MIALPACHKASPLLRDAWACLNLGTVRHFCCGLNLAEGRVGQARKVLTVSRSSCKRPKKEAQRSTGCYRLDVPQSLCSSSPCLFGGMGLTRPHRHSAGDLRGGHCLLLHAVGSRTANRASMDLRHWAPLLGTFDSVGLNGTIGTARWDCDAETWHGIWETASKVLNSQAAAPDNFNHLRWTSHADQDRCPIAVAVGRIVHCILTFQRDWHGDIPKLLARPIQMLHMPFSWELQLVLRPNLMLPRTLTSRGWHLLFLEALGQLSDMLCPGGGAIPNYQQYCRDNPWTAGCDQSNLPACDGGVKWTKSPEQLLLEFPSAGVPCLRCSPQPQDMAEDRANVQTQSVIYPRAQNTGTSADSCTRLGGGDASLRGCPAQRASWNSWCLCSRPGGMH